MFYCYAKMSNQPSTQFSILPTLVWVNRVTASLPGVNAGLVYLFRVAGFVVMRYISSNSLKLNLFILAKSVTIVYQKTNRTFSYISAYISAILLDSESLYLTYIKPEKI